MLIRDISNSSGKDGLNGGFRKEDAEIFKTTIKQSNYRPIYRRLLISKV